MVARLCLLLSATVAFDAGCADPACEALQPSFQVDLEMVATSSGVPVVSVRVDVDAASVRRIHTLDGARLAAEGSASFVVLVGSGGSRGFEVEITAEALDASDHVLARGHDRFSAAGNGCNRFSLRLLAEASPVDGAIDGGADGPVDSIGDQPGPSCEDGTCVECRPVCTGKTCGADDGCGESCQPGSGCITPPDCVETADPDTLLLYTFEGTGSTVTDVAGNHTGSAVGTAVTRVAGKNSCGNAINFGDSAEISYILVPNSSDWDLDEGSIDFWVRFDGASDGANNEGLASRDAISDAQAGHLSILRMCDGSIMARMQDTSSAWAQCSNPVAGGAWHHVGLNFGGTGGLQLFVDGKAATRTSSIVCDKTWPCGASSSKGIAGNTNPWTLGAESWRSDEGSATPVDGPLRGRMDSFRISDVRRNF